MSKLRILLACTATAAALLTGCSQRSEAELLASAKGYIQRNDPKAAVIELKSALQQNASSGEARFLLGQLLLEAGDPRNASIELRKARQSKFPDDLVVPALARAMVAEDQFKALIDQFGKTVLGQETAQAELKAMLAAAHARLGQRALAQAALDDALKLEPANASASLVQARMRAGSGDLDGALTAVRATLARRPSDVDALLLLADLLLYGKRDDEGALQAYRQVVAQHQASMPGHSGIINVLLHRQDIEGARQQFSALNKVLPGHIQTKFFDAQFAFLAGDLAGAREKVAQLLKVAPRNARLLQFAGTVELQLGSFLQAEAQLGKALRTDPELQSARLLLARTHLRGGQPAKALVVLQPVLAAPQPPSEAMALAAESFLLVGEAPRAVELFNRAAERSPDDPKLRAALALTRLARGEADAAFSELQSLAVSQPDTYADLALISVRFSRKDLDGALRAIEGLDRKQPGKPLAEELRGKVALQRKDAAAARQHFAAALQRDPVYFPAASQLARLDLAERRYEQAESHFQGILKAEPRNARALLAVAEVRQRAGAPAASIEPLLVDAVKADSGEAAARVALVEHHLRQGSAKQALVVAQDAIAALPEQATVLEVLGVAQMAAGEGQQAVTTFKKLAAMLPSQPGPLVRLAEAHMAVRQPDVALDQLRRALDLAPDHPGVQKVLMGLAVQTRHHADALAVARLVQKRQPQRMEGYAYEGDIQASRKSWDAAIAAYRAALGKTGGAAVAARLHATLKAAGRAGEADAFAAAQSKARPEDAGFWYYLGDHALAEGNWALAERRYLEVTRRQGDNPGAWNNLAWAVLKQGRAQEALTHAERAASLLPSSPAMLDTLAQVLSASGRHERALETARKAVALKPDEAALRLSLARTAIASGQKDVARSELDKLAALGDKFAGYDEVIRLKQQLGP